MARWSVVDGDQELVIESTPDGRVSLHVPSGAPFVVDTRKAQEVRTMIGAAIGAARESR